MQTFLPYASFVESLACLDDRRCIKQAVESWQIIHILLKKNKTTAWINHPAVKQWEGYVEALIEYYNLNLEERTKREFRNIKLVPLPRSTNIKYPSWLGDDKFHASHRAALLFKKYEHYSQFGWNEFPAINYFWPSKHQ